MTHSNKKSKQTGPLPPKQPNPPSSASSGSRSSSSRRSHHQTAPPTHDAFFDDREYIAPAVNSEEEYRRYQYHRDSRDSYYRPSGSSSGGMMQREYSPSRYNYEYERESHMYDVAPPPPRGYEHPPPGAHYHHPSYDPYGPPPPHHHPRSSSHGGGGREYSPSAYYDYPAPHHAYSPQEVYHPRRSGSPSRRPPSSSQYSHPALPPPNKEPSPAVPPPPSSESSSSTSSSKKRKRPNPDRYVKNTPTQTTYLYTYSHDYTLHALSTLYQSRPQNNIPKYPILSQDRQDLIRLKKQQLEELRDRREIPRNIFAKKCQITREDILSLQSTFDVVMIQCPENYSLDEIASLDVDHLARAKSFLFLWVGARGVQWGTSLLAHWGFKRVEILTWAKTNSDDNDRWEHWEQSGRIGVPPLPSQSDASVLPTPYQQSDEYMMFRPTVEHCLVANRGNFSKKEDDHMFHANLDNDVIVAPESTDGALPEQIYDIIERSCLGKRKVELFGDMNSLRPGWLTMGPNVPFDNYSPETYNTSFGGSLYIGTTHQIDSLRPKDSKLNVKR